MSRSWLAIGAIVASATLCRIAVSTQDTAPVHEVSFDFRTHQPIVPVRVNGGRAVPFLVDTGASVNIVDDQVAREAAVERFGGTTMRGAGEALVQGSFASSLTLETTGIRLERQRATIVRLGYPDTKHFGGMIGAPILMRYVVQFDYAKHVLRFIEPAVYKPGSGAVLVPFELQDGLPVVRATVDAGSGALEARLMFDTGFGCCDSTVILYRPFVDAHRLLDVLADPASRERPVAIGGSAPFVVGTGRRVMLGGVTFNRPRLSLSRGSQGSTSRSDRDGLIGNDLLSEFVVTVDYSRRVLALDPNAADRGRPPRPHSESRTPPFTRPPGG